MPELVSPGDEVALLAARRERSAGLLRLGSILIGQFLLVNALTGAVPLLFGASPGDTPVVLELGGLGLWGAILVFGEAPYARRQATPTAAVPPAIRRRDAARTALALAAANAVLGAWFFAGLPQAQVVTATALAALGMAAWGALVIWVVPFVGSSAPPPAPAEEPPRV